MDGELDGITEKAPEGEVVGIVLGSPVILKATEGISDLVLVGAPVVRSALGKLVATSEGFSVGDSETSIDGVGIDEASMLGLMLFDDVGTADSFGSVEGASNAIDSIGRAARRRT